MQCPNCSSHDTHDGGLQWFPLRVFEALHTMPTVRDTGRPSEGALQMFTCADCHTTFLEEALPAVASTSGD